MIYRQWSFPVSGKRTDGRTAGRPDRRTAGLTDKQNYFGEDLYKELRVFWLKIFGLSLRLRIKERKKKNPDISNDKNSKDLNVSGKLNCFFPQDQKSA